MTRPDASLTVTGYASRDPELRFTPSGTAVANVDVPWTPRRFNRNTNQWEDAGDTLWVQVSVWGDEAEAFAENVFKGTLLTVTGRPRLSVFTGRDGTPRASLGLSADVWGLCPKTPRNNGQAQQGGAFNYAQRSGYNAPAGGSADDPWATGGQFKDEPPF